MYPKRFAGQALRRAFLCGQDSNTGQDCEHRRGWIEERILKLATIFAIDVAAYAVMSNHYHVVSHIDRDQAQQWSDEEIFTRWLALFSGQGLASRFIKQEPLDRAEQQQLSDLILVWQQRLMDISWFMRCLNDKIIRNDFEQPTGWP